MSETTDPQDGATQAEPAATDDTTPIAPGTEGAATEPVVEPEHKPSREDRRIAALTARLAAGENERARLAGELDAYRRKTPTEPDKPLTVEDIPRVVEEKVAAEVARRAEIAKVEGFHAAGRAAYPDWQDRCSSLMAMGADPEFAKLLVETEDGAKIAAALADDPEELERIVGLKSDRGRAMALGKYAAEMAGKPAPVSRSVSRVPPPIRPLGNGAVRTEFNESKATAQELVEYYTKQENKRRGVN
jgi:hypothetical protein